MGKALPPTGSIERDSQAGHCPELVRPQWARASEVHGTMNGGTLGTGARADL